VAPQGEEAPDPVRGILPIRGAELLWEAPEEKELDSASKPLIPLTGPCMHVLQSELLVAIGVSLEKDVVATIRLAAMLAFTPIERSLRPITEKTNHICTRSGWVPRALPRPYEVPAAIAGKLKNTFKDIRHLEPLEAALCHKPQRHLPLHAPDKEWFLSAGLLGSLPLFAALASVSAPELWGNALLGAASSDQVDVVSYLIEKVRIIVDYADEASRSAFAFATRAGSEGVIRLLITKHKANPFYVTVKGRTALHLAAKNGREHFLDLLLHKFNFDPNVADKYATRPVHEAVMHNHLKCVQMLIEAGANPQLLDGRGSTVLHVAASKGNIAMCSYLLSIGLDIDAENFQKNRATPLHFAIISGCIETVKFLLDRGANMYKNHGSYTCDALVRRLVDEKLSLPPGDEIDLKVQRFREIQRVLIDKRRELEGAEKPKDGPAWALLDSSTP
jgi:hypothetical protein